MSVKLGDIAERMAQGIRTSANDVYVVDLITQEKNLTVAYSKELDKNVTLDNGILSSFLQGREIKTIPNIIFWEKSNHPISYRR